VINEPEISRQHARITTELYPDKQVFEIQDIQSQNGTYVNGERISRKSLTPSDRITLGTKTQLSWDQIAYAINQKMSSDIPTPEPLGPSIPHFEERTYIPEPEFQNGYQPQSPRNRSNPGLLIAGVVVGLFILIGGIMVVASGKGRLTSTGSQMNSQAQLLTYPASIN
jgi:hypothetical protein